MTQAQKKELLRNSIITASLNYKNYLMGKYFLYIFKDDYIEVLFKKDRFSHLTGVETSLSGDEFFDQAKLSKLSSGQFWFTAKHPFATAVEKTDCLIELYKMTINEIHVLKSLKTSSIVYSFGLTNLSFTIGLTENIDKKTKKKIDNFYLPRTLRVKDDCISKSASSSVAKLVLSKDNMFQKYSKVTYGNPDDIKKLPPNILELIDKSLYT